MVLIDTNIFLEVFLDQERANECLAFLDKIEDGSQKGYITDFSIHSIGVIISSINNGKHLKEISASLSSFEGLSLISASIDEHIAIASLAEQTSLDFDDAYQFYFCKKFDIPIVSYDSDFDKYIERKEPKDFFHDIKEEK